MKKRLFVALALPDFLRDILIKFQEENKRFKLRWSKKENLHITVLFLGYVEISHLREIMQILGELANKSKPINLKTENIVEAPSAKAPRMFWARLAHNEDFSQLSFQIEESLRIFLPKNFVKREPAPHITLARFENKKEIEKVKKIEIKGNPFLVDHLKLFESQPTKTGSRYTEIASFPFNQFIQ